MHRFIREPVNSLTHFVGALLSVAGLVWLLVDALSGGPAWRAWPLAVFGGSMVLLFTASTLYHSLPVSERWIAVLRRMDHMSIFIFIAGTYTPFCVLVLGNALGWTLFGVVWGLAGAGLVMRLAWMNAPRWLYVLKYLVMGWIVVLVLPDVAKALPGGALTGMAVGGALYTVGALVYALRRPNPFPGIFGFHEIWHFFVLGGAFAHFWTIRTYVAAVSA